MKKILAAIAALLASFSLALAVTQVNVPTTYLTTATGVTNGAQIQGFWDCWTTATTGCNQGVEIYSGGIVNGTSNPLYIDDTSGGNLDTVLQSIKTNTGAPLIANDPCLAAAKTNLPISFNGTTSTQQIALSGATKIYICSIHLIAAAATVFNITTGTGTNCASGTPAAIFGSLTTANGESYAANGGIAYGNGGGTVGVTPAGYALCFAQTNAVYVSGNLTYVQQ